MDYYFKEKREQNSFDNFNYIKIASYSEEKLKKLKSDSGIIRNEMKIKAAKKNSISFIEVQKEFGTFSSKYLWSFIDYKPIQNHFKRINEIPTKHTIII